MLSSPAGAFDVAGTFPLKMKVVGVLAPTGTADDEAVFVDLKTAWVIAGLAHGHTDVTAPGCGERRPRGRGRQRGRQRLGPVLHRDHPRQHRLASTSTGLPTAFRWTPFSPCPTTASRG